MSSVEDCARGDRSTYNAERGGYDCGGCDRHFTLRGFNVHVRAARRRLKDEARIAALAGGSR